LQNRQTDTPCNERATLAFLAAPHSTLSAPHTLICIALMARSIISLWQDLF
jgi:hypothetical protein